ncbi:DNA-binding transcriptional LysR family regulator [Rhizobium sp. BK196]|uniref:LysR substrate-binding domain-containing protein n=1 Tax=Rhizobium sp. BK196 TaxID=2587073 RepID=UPI0016148514|nr:LysR substrate-binding domain-containing protein [Rhizobium sp. BK196]MBB3312902.1 DNA-binding transcriptional LysR family regulator [Rhizobium sp. BK196]
MTLEQLRIFVEVAARQHITKAAAHLNMTQSAVSAAVTALETRHGVTLFDRVGRSIVLNRTGKLFLKEAHAVLTSAKAAEAALVDLSGLMHGELTIMASQTIGGYWLSPRLVAFRRRYPGIELTIRIGNTAEVSDAVANGEVEVGLIEWPSERRGVSARKIALDEMIVVVAPSHPWADGKARSPSDFPQTQWVLREQGSGTRLAFESLLQKAGLDIEALEIAMVLPENEPLVGVVEAGIGATLMSRSVVAMRLRNGLLTEVNVPAQPRPFFLLRHEERYRSKAADTFDTMISG